MSAPPLTTGERRAVESWFRRRGLPRLIAEHSATTDIYTRAAPLLALVFVFSFVNVFDDRFTGWGQMWFTLATLVFLFAVAAGVNRLRGRRPLQIPDRVGPLELAVFVLAPAVPPLLGSDPLTTVALTIGGQLLVLALVWLVVGFGLISVIRWAVANLGDQLGDVLGLMLRSLPLLLLFTMFLFLNAELWQVANDFTPALFWMATLGLGGLAVLFLVIRLPRLLQDVGRFDTADDVVECCAGADAPLTVIEPPAEPNPPLARTDRVNVGVLAVFAIGVQVVLVTLLIGAFYLLFGMVAVREATIAQWTVGDGLEVIGEFTVAGAQVALTGELLRVTGFLMGFSALQFTVNALTDTTYRREFLGDLETEIREALAVRAVYLDRLD